MSGGRFILGEEVTAFEREFAHFLGVNNVVGTGNGTDALVLALRAVGVRPGDRVLTVSHSAVATVTAILISGAQPVFVDIDPETYTMAPEDLDRAIRRCGATSSTGTDGPLRAVIAVHLYGHPVDMTRILEISRSAGLKVVEDCAQAHGATIAGQLTGSWGDVAAFSFYPTKNLGAFGDGGAVASNDESIAQKCRYLREYGWDSKRVSQEAGYNSRLDELQAALLRVKLRHLESENDGRCRLAALYNRSLEGLAVVTPRVGHGVSHAYHQYVIRTRDRESLRTELERTRIGSAIHYSPPSHLHPAFRVYRDSPLRETERAAAEVLSLPMYPQLSTENAARVCSAVEAWTRS
jgi:dTDP-4-amino-4,6-dideoxygalactose transaminase